LTLEGWQEQLIHWAGLGWGKALEEMPRSEILLHFENIYYSHIPLGAWLRQRFITPLKIVAKKILQKPESHAQPEATTRISFF
jgi:hypothetical protein